VTFCCKATSVALLPVIGSLTFQLLVYNCT
jgi:hypothetical protein